MHKFYYGISFVLSRMNVNSLKEDKSRVDAALPCEGYVFLKVLEMEMCTLVDVRVHITVTIFMNMIAIFVHKPLDICTRTYFFVYIVM